MCVKTLTSCLLKISRQSSHLFSPKIPELFDKIRFVCLFDVRVVAPPPPKHPWNIRRNKNKVSPSPNSMAVESQSHHPSPTIINRHQPSSPSQSLLKNCFLRQHPSQEYKKDEDDDPSRRHISLTVERNGGRFFLLCSFSLVVTHHHPRNNTNTKTLLERSKTGVDLKPPLSATLPCRDRSWVRFLLFNRQNRKK